MKKNRAFLKWAGGKYPLLDDIKKHLPEGECLIEPFVGAGSYFSIPTFLVISSRISTVI
ncbi:hypothetical protein G7L32_06920 [Klebsiella quasipneumoniae]|nr:hypothetical protein [Klebsiella quasipneumoniae]